MLSKSKFVGGWQCEKQAYLTANFPKLATPFDSGTLARFAGGTRFGELARELWPDGVLISSPAFRHDASVKWTQDLIAGDAVDTIFEAGFTNIGVRVRADVMIRNRETEKWDLIEVKSALSPKQVYDIDMTIQRAVIEASGITVGTTGVMLVNGDYVRGDTGIKPDGLFKIFDRTKEVLDLLPEVKKLNSRLQKIILSEDVPDIEVGPHCEKPYTCQFFAHCTVDRPRDWIKYLPGFGAKKVADFEARGVVGAKDIPDEERLNKLQQRAVRSINQSTPWVSDQLSENLTKVGYPVRFIDFETVQPMVPTYPDMRPRELIPFQWSCHTLGANNSLEHSDYLAAGDVDPSREFVESLLRALGIDEGPILVYSSYEQSTLRKMATKFADLAPDIEKLIDRFVDLLAMVKENYYHPGFKGSFSIKNVLPVMVPGYDYSDLAIGEGEAASATYVDIVEGRLVEEELDDALFNLLEYCKRDTEAMVRIWQRLEEISRNRES